jgi:acyl transferase domain-containing protein/acyl carrier protein
MSTTPDFREQFKRSLTKIAELKAQVAQLQANQNEPIAITGMACRLPGAGNPEQYWEQLEAGKDLIREIPHERGLAGWPEDVPRWAGLLDNVDRFDPAFFGISPREAVSLDPQQRLLLEVSWEALEHARIIPSSLRASNTGVFVGLCTIDYYHRVLSLDPADRDMYSLIGNLASTAAGRISYTLGLEGPAITLDTACSSSLVAIHLACNSLRREECSLALVGGAHTIVSEQSSVGLARTNALSPDGRCRTFDQSANGFVRGEGCGILVLERLSTAQRAGRRVLAVIRGSAVNQDGRSSGLTAPNVLAQQTVLREALKAAGVGAEQISYIECHGTGTPLGDPIEVEAIKSVFIPSRNPESKLWLGAVKTNIGHLEAAAGVAGVIKIIQCLRHGRIPKNLHLKHINPLLGLSKTPLIPVTQVTDWTPEPGSTRVAGVSAFGISGTNAHVIIEEPPTSDPPEPPRSSAQFPVPVLLSARSEAALRGQATRLRDYLERHADIEPIDLAYSLATTRTFFEHRAFGLVSTKDRLGNLADIAEHGPTGRLPRDSSNRIPKVAMLFTGQGSQRASMGAGLWDAFPRYREVFDEICSHFDKLLDKPLAEVIFATPGSPDAALLEQTAHTQPALFTLEVAVYRLFEHWGVTPDVLLGHSIGELAAAHIAGVFSLADACKLVAARGRLMQALPAVGAMVSIQASEQELAQLLERHPGVDIAGLNGPLSTVISGDEQPVLALARYFESIGRKTKRLTVSHAFHSHHMDAMLDDFAKVAESIAYQLARIPIVSNVSGRLAEPNEMCSADYWVRHVRSAVRFLDGVRTLEAMKLDVLLELGPHGVLSAMAAACLPDGSEPVAIAALRNDRAEPESVVSALAVLHCQGVSIDWPGFFAPYSPRQVDLPTYAFERQRYWLEVPNRPTPALGDAARSWCYEIEWVPLSESQRAPAPGAWLIVVPTTSSCEELLGGLRSALAARAIDGRVLAIAPTDDREQLGAKLRGILAELVPQYVLSLLALEQSPHPDHPSVPLGFALNLALVQALGDLHATAPLWMLTQSAVSTRKGDPLRNPLQTMTWGFGCTLSLEQPDRWGGLLDLPEPCDMRLVARLPEVLSRDDFEDQLALREEGWFSRRLVRMPAAVGKRVQLRTTGTALITGGTGALGVRVARWLIARGLEHIVLGSRRGLEAPGARELQAEFEALGARVSIVACEFADRDAVAALLDRISAEHPPVTVIVHTAGVAGTTTAIEQLRLADVAETMAGKVLGARNLHELTQSRDLDLFISYASISGTWGSGQQSAYASANAFLDALAVHRAQQHLPALSIAWGPWADGGMAGEDALDFLVRRGLRPMAPKQAMDALASVVATDRAAVVVADVDWANFSRSYAAARRRPLLAVVAEASIDDPGGEASPTISIVDELRPLSPEDRAQRLLDLVLEHTAAVLGMTNVASLDPGTGFSDLGLDSLMAVELRQRLQRATGAALPATLAFDFPSPRHVATSLLSRLEFSSAEHCESTPTPTDLALEELDGDDLLSAADLLLGDN